MPNLAGTLVLVPAALACVIRADNHGHASVGVGQDTNFDSVYVLYNLFGQDVLRPAVGEIPALTDHDNAGYI